jgi:hypothetical protein
MNLRVLGSQSCLLSWDGQSLICDACSIDHDTAAKRSGCDVTQNIRTRMGQYRPYVLADVYLKTHIIIALQKKRKLLERFYCWKEIHPRSLLKTVLTDHFGSLWKHLLGYKRRSANSAVSIYRTVRYHFTWRRSYRHVCAMAVMLHSKETSTDWTLLSGYREKIKRIKKFIKEWNITGAQFHKREHFVV